jgi:DNA-binding winged helix-turn-helix (wHTH) protein/tetratricopeptide (TPR) repeat protein
MPDSARPTIDGARHRFGVFEFDSGTMELRKDGRLVRVRPQSLRLLALLLARPGELVSRDDIQQALWGRETFVDFEQGVNHCIKELRAALGDVAESPRYIQTLPRRGYKFIAPVENATAGTPAPAAQPPRRLSASAWVAGALFAIVVAAAAVASYTSRAGRDPVPAASRLTVMPFTAARDPALGTGLANAIAARLGGQGFIPVQPMGRGASVVAPSEGRPIVLEGEIDDSAATLVLVVRLKQVASGTVVWTDRFLVRADELFSVEDVVTERVVAALNLRLAAAEQERLRRRYTSNAAAYEQYLRGRAALVRYTPEGTLEAIQAFEAALQKDASYALARAGLAMACADMYLRFARSGDVDRWGDRAESEARAALELDPDLAEAHLARAAVARKREFDWNGTMAASRRALILNPNLDQARFFMAAAYYHLAYMEEALMELEKGRSLRGTDVVEPARIEALVALFSGRFGVAREHLEEVSRLSSQAIGDTYLALAYYYSGSAERGRTLLETLEKHTSASTSARSAAALAGVLAAQGDAAAAHARVKSVLSREYRDHHVAYSLGAAYSQLGDFDESLRWLRTAADTGFPCLTWFERDPLLEPLRRRAEFQELTAYVRTRRDASLLKDR